MAIFQSSLSHQVFAARAQIHCADAERSVVVCLRQPKSSTQTETSKSATPEVSITVGTSGRIRERRAEAIAKAQNSSFNLAEAMRRVNRT
jgi:hypothetical protein